MQSLTQRLQTAENELSGIAEERSKYREIIVNQSNQLVDSEKELGALTAKYETAKLKADQHDVCVN